MAVSAIPALAELMKLVGPWIKDAIQASARKSICFVCFSRFFFQKADKIFWGSAQKQKVFLKSR